MSEQQITPEVLWAQRSSSSDPTKNHIFLTISVPDVSKEDMKLDLQPISLTFTGKSQTKKATYHVELEFYAEIVPEESKINHTARDIEMVLRKKELKEEYWPRLLKDAKKVHFLKTDFDKWVDEDEQNEVADDDDYMARMGGMGGMGGDGGFGGIDFSKLGGGAGGMPDLGAMGGMGGDDSDDDLPDDDNDMPGLEGEDHSVPKTETGGDAEEVPAATGETGASATKTSAKIEEVE